jgi:putative nucleotidyltransferase with HDIG domain
MYKDGHMLGWRGYLSSNQRGWRFVAGLVCAFFLALFLHFREVRLSVLELNMVASHYVIAQIDFEFPDEEETFILRQQASQDIGKIYQLDDRSIRQGRYEIEEDLIHDRKWHKEARSSNFEEMYKIADAIETLLLESRFTDLRTIQKIKGLNIPDASYYAYRNGEGDGAVGLPTDFWEKIGIQVAQSDAFHQDAINYMLKAFGQKSWNLVEDGTLEQQFRSQVIKAIPEKLTKIYAGTRILDPGEKVTSRHLAMMESMKLAIADSRQLWDPLTITASIILSLIFVIISALYFRISQIEFIRSFRQIALFVCIVILTLIFAKLTEYVLIRSSSTLIQGIRYPIVAPFATLLICILLSPRTALFAATFLSIILSVSLAIDHSRFLILNLVTSIVVIIASRHIRRRNEVFAVCVKSWIASIPVLYAYVLSDHRFWSGSFMIDVMSSAMFLFVIAILVVGLLPALESIFGALTDMTLMEYMDPSSELLRKFAMEVPGTYQHSLVLGNLSEACAQAIGANGLFCRAATLYHDIGKMNNPQFYTENQQSNVNIHQLLTPVESAQVIISHVIDGVTIAKQYRLPGPFIDIIKEHHGTTLVYYFYRKQLDLMQNNPALVDEKQFRYPGPTPHTKESAIIMICDSVEATSRSLEKIDEQSLREMVDRVVLEKGEERQFDQCQLTFEELHHIKNVLVKTLLLTYHVRVKYPKRMPTK